MTVKPCAVNFETAERCLLCAGIWSTGFGLLQERALTPVLSKKFDERRLDELQDGSKTDKRGPKMKKMFLDIINDLKV